MDENIKIASFHEAGHALMAFVVGWTIYSIDLEIEDGSFKKGVTNYNFGGDTDQNWVNLNRRVHCLMGGPILEAFIRGEEEIDLDLLGCDGILIDELLEGLSAKESIIQDAINQTANILNFPVCRKAAGEISNILIVNGKISNEVFTEIVSRNNVPQVNFDN